MMDLQNIADLLGLMTGYLDDMGLLVILQTGFGAMVMVGLIMILFNRITGGGR